MRIKFLCDTYTGNSIAENVKKTKYTNTTEGFNYIGTKDVGFDNSVAYENGVKIPYKEEKFRFAYPEDILLCIEGGSAGRKIAILSQQVCFGNKLCNFHQYLNLSRFLYYFLQSPYFFDIFKGNIAGIIGGVSVNKIKELLLPLPPLSEQGRIVKKIEELEPFIEEYGKTEVELTALNSNFPEQIKKSILQYAIQGKLVEQDPNDEPASVLLEKIKAEKQELIKQGKIKKDKQESYIYKGADNRHYEKIGLETKDITDEIPFEIPESWSWCRLGSVGITQTGMTPATSHSEYFGKDIPFIKPADISNLSINYHNEGLSFEGIKYARLIKAKSILMVCIGGSIGKCYVNNCDVCCNQQINTFTPILSDFLYFLYLMQSDYFYKTTIFNATGTATPIINKSDWGNIIIPLPPLSEQLRIVEKLKNILKTIELL